MTPGTEKQRRILVTVLFCMTAVILILSWFLYGSQQKTRELTDAMNLLELNLEAEQKEARLKYDSLQSRIFLQVNLHNRLKEEVSSLEKIKAEINNTADENKSTILCLHDIDSLRDEVARHYRR